MLQTTCPPTCPLVQVLFHFVGPKLEALDRQNSEHSFVVIYFSAVFELEIVIIIAENVLDTFSPFF